MALSTRRKTKSATSSSITRAASRSKPAAKSSAKNWELTALLKIRALLQKGWTQGHNAITKNGDGITCNSPHAASFCLNGALRRVTGSNAKQELKLYRTIESHLGGKTVVGYNDTPGRTKQEVLTTLATVIEAQKAI